MSLCVTCNSIPIRQLATHDMPPEWEVWEWPDTIVDKLQNSDRSPGGEDELAWVCDRLMCKISKIRQSATTCRLCHTIVDLLLDQAGNERGGDLLANVIAEDRIILMHLFMGVDYLKLNLEIRGKPPSINILVGSIEFTVAFDSSLAEEELGWAVPQDTLDPIVLRRWRTWLQNCNSEHPECDTYQECNLLPTRLIDLSGLPQHSAMTDHNNAWRQLFSSGQCKLIETRPRQMGRYATLSYCWGDSLPYKTNIANIDQHLVAIYFDDLPRTLQDAVMVARFFDMEFLWIDCLCIVQESRHDWEREALRMVDVYAHSYLGIVASRASHCNEGFLGSRDISQLQHCRFEDATGYLEIYLKQIKPLFEEGNLFSEHPQHTLIEPLPLDQRAWALQEILLAPRQLSFSHDDTHWRCACMLRSEYSDFDKNLNKVQRPMFDIGRALTGMTLGNVELQRSWSVIVSRYSDCSLSLETDKLPALSGIVTKLQDLTGDVCFAGIWKRHFLYWLLWRRSHGQTLKRPLSWRAPSWSFAAIDGPVTYLRLFEERVVVKVEYVSQLEDCQITPKGQNLLGELIAGFARINGPVTTIELQQSFLKACDFGWIYLMHGLTTPVSICLDMEVFVCSEADEPVETSMALMLNKNSGLLIKEVEGDDNTFIRVGMFWMNGEPDYLQDTDYPESRSVILL
ncbi:hypothetical protein NX059_002556 [Plenodomus lindquistii]|nr:hypothetical protein NX059_002556 [Plenodomus lindquistii]